MRPSTDFRYTFAQNDFPAQYTNVTFLEPFDPLYTTLQKSFISKQTAAYGIVSRRLTDKALDQNKSSSHHFCTGFEHLHARPIQRE